MPSKKNFKGNLLHSKLLITSAPSSALATGNEETVNTEFEIIDPDLIRAGDFVKFPILKGIQIFIRGDVEDDLDLGTGERYTATATVYKSSNANKETNDAVAMGHQSAYGGSAGCHSYNSFMTKNFSQNGYLLPPKITVQINIKNQTGTNISTSQFDVFVTLDIDWVDVSKSEFDDYLKEDYLIEVL